MTDKTAQILTRNVIICLTTGETFQPSTFRSQSCTSGLVGFGSTVAQMLGPDYPYPKYTIGLYPPFILIFILPFFAFVALFHSEMYRMSLVIGDYIDLLRMEPFDFQVMG